jgi:hypothetical protein
MYTTEATAASTGHFHCNIYTRYLHECMMSFVYAQMHVYQRTRRMSKALALPVMEASQNLVSGLAMGSGGGNLNVWSVLKIFYMHSRTSENHSPEHKNQMD